MEAGRGSLARVADAIATPAMLHINDLTIRIGDRLLFDRARLHLRPKEKAGLLGRNGTGKSTLLAMIAGDGAAESGEIRLRPRASVSLVAQEAPSGERTPLAAVLDADVELRRLERAAESEQDPERIAEIHTRLADLDAHAAPARAAAILAGLGFDEAAQRRPLDSFSGGWRMRVALAGALFRRPDLLLLDEPTNYLDLEGALWLESFLASYPGAALIVSHDRTLLNAAVDRIIHLEQGKFVSYAGGYDAFEKARAERIERIAAMRSKQEAERRHLQAFVDRFRYKASKASQAQSRLKMLERMQPISAVVEDRTVPFSFPKPRPLSPPLMVLDGAAAGYGDGPPVLRGLDLRIDPEDRIALLGANGNGKSTFAKLLSRRLAPSAGRLEAPRALNVGYFAQHQLDELRPAESPLQHLAALAPERTETWLRTRLGGFGFSADKADRPVETLSGGEKARLLFALMAFEAPQLMILDEPTNHLDIDSREALIRALNEFDGAVILISHDRRLLDCCADRLWVAEGGTVQPFEGDLEAYRRQLLQTRGGRSETARSDGATPDPRKARRRQAAQARAQRAPLKSRIEEAEKKIAALTARKERLDKALASPGLYDGSIDAAAAKTVQLQQELARVEDALAAAEDRWVELQDALDNAEARA